MSTKVHISIGMNAVRYNRENIINWFKQNGIQTEVIPDSNFMKTETLEIAQTVELLARIVPCMDAWGVYSVRIEKESDVEPEQEETPDLVVEMMERIEAPGYNELGEDEPLYVHPDDRLGTPELL